MSLRHKYRHTYTWCSETAYLCGLFASDGCLSKDGRHLNITSKDEEIIQFAVQYLGLHIKIDQKTSPYGSLAYNLQFSNVSLYDFLAQCGLTPAKSKTMPPLRIPDKYYADFVRGYFDGDGTVYGYWDKRWSSSLMYYSGFVSASEPFLKWLADNNARLIGTKTAAIKQGVRAKIITYAKVDSLRLFNAMYADPTSFRLRRKYEKYKDFILLDPYAKISMITREC